MLLWWDTIFLTSWKIILGVSCHSIFSLSRVTFQSHEKCVNIYTCWCLLRQSSMSWGRQCCGVYLCKVGGRSSQTCVNYLIDFWHISLLRCSVWMTRRRHTLTLSENWDLISRLEKINLACVKRLSFIQWNRECDEKRRMKRVERHHAENLERQHNGNLCYQLAHFQRERTFLGWNKRRGEACGYLVHYIHINIK